jgi:hypothetical protein
MPIPPLDARTVVQRMMPARLRRWVRAQLLSAPVDPSSASGPYEASWETHGARLPRDESVGPGDFDLVGRVEFGLL